jgi:Spy/CpxP family protein refolding chaperone
MKNITKSFLIAMGAALLSLPVLRAEEAPAGGPPPPEHRERKGDRKGDRMKDMGEHMAKELGLTAEQQTQMKALMVEEKKAADAIRDDASLTPEQKKEKGKQLRQDFQGKRQALMTPEQRKKAEEMRAKHPEGGPRHKDKGEGGPDAK